MRWSFEYWSAWENSREEKLTKRAQDRDGQKTTDVKTETQAGDPKFLAGIQWCVTKRCEILGLYAPRQHQITSATAGRIEHEHRHYSIDQRRAEVSRLAEKLRAAPRLVAHKSDRGEAEGGGPVTLDAAGEPGPVGSSSMGPALEDAAPPGAAE